MTKNKRSRLALGILFSIILLIILVLIFSKRYVQNVSNPSQNTPYSSQVRIPIHVSELAKKGTMVLLPGWYLQVNQDFDHSLDSSRPIQYIYITKDGYELAIFSASVTTLSSDCGKREFYMSKRGIHFTDQDGIEYFRDNQLPGSEGPPGIYVCQPEEKGSNQLIHFTEYGMIRYGGKPYNEAIFHEMDLMVASLKEEKK
jgi:hypothetical protein